MMRFDNGAAAKGGRFNRAGIRARYLAVSPEAALREYQQASTLLSPATIASFQVTADPVVVTAGYNADEWLDIWQEAYCNWKDLAFMQNVDPPSWVIGDLVHGSLRHALHELLRDGLQMWVSESRACVSRSAAHLSRVA